MPDRDDPNRPVKDGMHPPSQPQLVHCLHCGEEYDSWRIEWVVDAKSGHGFWCCPIDGCSGAGFGMDIWPVDYDEDGRWVDPEDGREMGWSDDGEEDEEDWDEDDVGDLPRSPPPSTGKFDPDDWGDDAIPF